MVIHLGLVSRLRKIKELTYDGVFLERPMSNLVDFDFRNILDPPPANDSKTTKLELETVSRFTSRRTQKDIELIYKVDGNIDQIYINILSKYKIYICLILFLCNEINHFNCFSRAYSID